MKITTQEFPGGSVTSVHDEKLDNRQASMEKRSASDVRKFCVEAINRAIEVMLNNEHTWSEVSLISFCRR
jgi:hypothetical protein